MAAKQGTILNGDAVRTKVSVHYRQGGHKSGVVVKKGSTENTLGGAVGYISALPRKQVSSQGQSTTVMQHQTCSLSPYEYLIR